MSNNPEDLKLLTLATATQARSGSASAAALRDTTGRTYVAIPVAIGEFHVDAIHAVLVVALASQISGIEAIVVAGTKPEQTSIDAATNFSASAQVFWVNPGEELELL